MLFVGGNFEAKGGTDLLDALEPMLGDTVDLQLVTASDVQPRAGIQVYRLNPGDPELVDLYQQADIFCLPAKADPSPNAVLEALACGTPVVTTSHAGIPDLVDHGHAGVLVPPENPRLLREALTSLLADGDKRDSLRRRGRERCEERYDTREQTARMLDLMRAACAERRGQTVLGTQR